MKFVVRKAERIDHRLYAIRDIPIFKEHTKYDKDGTVDRVDGETISKIVKRMKTYGPAAVIIGHTDDDNKYDEQDVVALAFNFRADKNDDGVTHLVCDIVTNDPDLLNKYPRRSVELWDDYTVNPIALLGSSTPRLDIPATIVKFSRKGTGKSKSRMDVIRRMIQDGYMLNADEEMRYCDRLDDKRFDCYVQLIRKYGRRKRPIDPYSVLGRFDHRKLDKEKVDQAIEYATVHNISFEEAVIRLFGNIVGDKQHG